MLKTVKRRYCRDISPPKTDFSSKEKVVNFLIDIGVTSQRAVKKAVNIFKKNSMYQGRVVDVWNLMSKRDPRYISKVYTDANGEEIYSVELKNVFESIEKKVQNDIKMPDTNREHKIFQHAMVRKVALELNSIK